MAKLTKVINGRYVGSDKYKITDTNDGKKQIVFSPDSVVEEGTPIGAEILNEIQNNGLYYLIGTHRVDGQESIYDCTLEGIDSFEFTQLCVLFKPDTTPTQSTIKLNISGQVYTLTGAKILNANQLGLILVKSELKAYVWSNYIKIVNDLTTGGVDNALSGEMGKKLNNEKFDKIGGTVNGNVTVTGTFTVNGATTIKSQQLEIYGNTPYIDFHYNNESNDFTSRFMDNGSGLEYVDGSGKNFNFRNILTSSILPSLYQRSGLARLFDGTYGDFLSKYQSGVYDVNAGNADVLPLLGLSNAYGFGVLIVDRPTTFSLALTYIPDNFRYNQMFVWCGYNVSNNPTTKFTDEFSYAWKNILQTKDDIGLGNVENVAQVTDVRFTGRTRISVWNQAVDTYAPGRVICGVQRDWEGNIIDQVDYATMQKKVRGTWYTLAVE